MLDLVAGNSQATVVTMPHIYCTAIMGLGLSFFHVFTYLISRQPLRQMLPSLFYARETPRHRG